MKHGSVTNWSGLQGMLQMLTGKHICQNISTLSLSACVFLRVCEWIHRQEKEAVIGVCFGFPVQRSVCVCMLDGEGSALHDADKHRTVHVGMNRAVWRCIGTTSLSWRRRVDMLYLLSEEGERSFLCWFQNHVILKSDSCCDGFGLGMVWAGLWLWDVRILMDSELVDFRLSCIFKYLVLTVRVHDGNLFLFT